MNVNRKKKKKKLSWCSLQTCSILCGVAKNRSRSTEHGQAIWVSRHLFVQWCFPAASAGGNKVLEWWLSRSGSSGSNSEHKPFTVPTLLWAIFLFFKTIEFIKTASSFLPSPTTLGIWSKKRESHLPAFFASRLAELDKTTHNLLLLKKSVLGKHYLVESSFLVFCPETAPSPPTSPNPPPPPTLTPIWLYFIYFQMMRSGPEGSKYFSHICWFNILPSHSILPRTGLGWSVYFVFSKVGMGVGGWWELRERCFFWNQLN